MRALFDKGGTTMSDIRSYVCTNDTPIYESPWDHSRIALGGTARLGVSNTILGQPSENDHIWIASGIGFVPDLTVQPLFAFTTTAATPIYQDHRLDAPIALGGQARLSVGQNFSAFENTPGWLWLATAVGFVPAGSATIIRDGRAYVVQSGDNLSSISQQFYATPDRWREIYLANRAVIGPDSDFIQPGQRLIIP
jgi:hypothetical protein